MREREEDVQREVSSLCSSHVTGARLDGVLQWKEELQSRNLNTRAHLGEKYVDGAIVLKWMLEIRIQSYGLDLGYCPFGRHYESENYVLTS